MRIQTIKGLRQASSFHLQTRAERGTSLRLRRVSSQEDGSPLPPLYPKKAGQGPLSTLQPANLFNRHPLNQAILSNLPALKIAQLRPRVTIRDVGALSCELKIAPGHLFCYCMSIPSSIASTITCISSAYIILYLAISTDLIPYIDHWVMHRWNIFASNMAILSQTI